jgi:hypothetical protein
VKSVGDGEDSSVSGGPELFIDVFHREGVL